MYILAVAVTKVYPQNYTLQSIIFFECTFPIPQQEALLRYLSSAYIVTYIATLLFSNSIRCINFIFHTGP